MADFQVGKKRASQLSAEELAELADLPELEGRVAAVASKRGDLPAVREAFVRQRQVDERGFYIGRERERRG